MSSLKFTSKVVDELRNNILDEISHNDLRSKKYNMSY